VNDGMKAIKDKMKVYSYYYYYLKFLY